MSKMAPEQRTHAAKQLAMQRMQYGVALLCMHVEKNICIGVRFAPYSLILYHSRTLPASNPPKYGLRIN